MYKNITLLLTIYKPKIEEINYWSGVYVFLKKKGVQFQVLIDNPDFDINLLNEFDGSDIYVNDVNKGKLRTIIDHIKNGYVKTTHFKSLDPDDFIFIDGFLRMKETLTKGMIRMKSVVVTDDHIDYELFKNITTENEDKIEKYLKTAKSFATAAMILPTEFIYNDTRFNSKSVINLAEDQLLATICMVNGSDLLDVDDYWYIYMFKNGITNSNIWDDKKNIDEMWGSVKVWKELLNESNESYESLWPSNIFNSFIKKVDREFREEIVSFNNFSKNLRKIGSNITIFNIFDNLDKFTFEKILEYKKKSKNKIFVIYKKIEENLYELIDKNFKDDFIEIEKSCYLEILKLIDSKKISTTHFKIISKFDEGTMKNYESRVIPHNQCIINQNPLSNNHKLFSKETSIYSTDKILQSINSIMKIEETSLEIYGDIIFGIYSLRDRSELLRVDIDVEDMSWEEQTTENKDTLINSFNEITSKNKNIPIDWLSVLLSSNRYLTISGTVEKIEEMNFVSFLDKNIIELFEMMLTSLKKTYSIFNWFVGVTSEIENEIKKIVGNDKRIIIRVVDDAIQHLDETALFGNITLLTYCRFYIKEIFNDISFDNRKFIYLDTDILIQKEIPNEYIDTEENIAVTNISSGGSMQSIKFWEGFFNRREMQVGDEGEKYRNVADEILSKIPKFKVFNAGVIIVNSPEKYFSLIEKIKNDDQKIMHLFDDQSLLNYYNDGEIIVKDDTRINFKIRKDFNFSKETSLVHFLGPNKYLMKRVHDDKLNFNLLNRENLIRYNVGIVVIKEPEEKIFIKEKLGKADLFIFNRIDDKLVPAILPNTIADLYFEDLNEVVKKVVNNKFVLVFNAVEFNKFELELLDKINYSTKDVVIPFDFTQKDVWENEVNNNVKMLLPTSSKDTNIKWEEKNENNLAKIKENNLELHLVELNSKEKINEK